MNSDNNKITELINSIQVDQSNFEHIAKTGKINGTLLLELRRILTPPPTDHIDLEAMAGSLYPIDISQVFSTTTLHHNTGARVGYVKGAQTIMDKVVVEIEKQKVSFNGYDFADDEKTANVVHNVVMAIYTDLLTTLKKNI